MNISEFIRQGAHTDTFENHRMLAWTEREANIGAADTLIDTEAFLEMSGYESEEYLQKVATYINNKIPTFKLYDYERVF